MNRAIKYRLYPTNEQATLFKRTFGCCRKVYNLMLSDKLTNYKATGKFGTFTPAMYKEDYPFLKEVDSLALANAQMALQAAFRNCFQKSRKKKNGFPKYKSKKTERKSYTTNNQHGTVAVLEHAVRLPKAGIVKAVIHRIPDPGWILKSATVSMDQDERFYISVLFEFEQHVEKISLSDNAIGFDYASDCLYVDDTGVRGTEHKYYHESQKKLARAQRILSRRRGSKKNEPKSRNFLKQLHKVNKIHRHISNQRKDHLHKLSTGIANRYDIVCTESLDMRTMSNKGFGNGKATMDNGYGMFQNMLEYKLLERGKYFVRVDKWFPSSQICHCCGHRQKMPLKIRVYQCHECGMVFDRDWNAAINIKKEGLRMLRAAV